MAEASSFMAFTQPQILLCGASPDAARRASPTLKGKLPVSNDKIRRHAAVGAVLCLLARWRGWMLPEHIAWHRHDRLRPRRRKEK